ncbi:MAG: aminotransferase class I/II-fold pyridoxal phosphate-dependent enzyme [Alphaproteobacteria bacterium]|nr:aminotransferase class I/II-fold pyridoxal phosphate-dependent enzyme [Alphaproteobacteria bacterium]
MAKLGFREWIAAGRAIADGELSRYNNKGRFTERFERALGDKVGARHVLSVTGGTAALTCALAAAGIGPGDEVLVPAYTWMATATAPVMVGAVPILVDIDETLTIDPADIERKITPYTKAIIPVHMVNVPCDMDAILAIARKHGLMVIEDACQAVGVRYKDRYCGAMGDLGAFSFNKYKNINIGEGGAVLTSDDTLFARARNYHDLGTSFRGHEETLNLAAFVGNNMRTTEIEGAMLGVQLKKLQPMLDRYQAQRQAVCEILGDRYRISPHNDPEHAVSLTVLFDTPEAAKAFAARGGAYVLKDNSKHVYTNWDAILNQRTFHPKMNPWAWAHRKIEYEVDDCARTLDILSRTCRIDLGSRLPLPLFKRRARKRWA